MPAGPSRKGEILTELILEIFRLLGVLEHHGAALTQPYGQTPARWQVMGAAAEKQRTVPHIARRMGLTRQGVQRVVSLLVREGLAKLVANPDHRRSPFVRLTRRGEEVLRAINAAQSVWSGTVAEPFAAGDLSVAARTVTALADRLRDLPTPK